MTSSEESATSGNPSSLSSSDCGSWRQGDVFDLDHIWVVDESDTPVSYPTPYGVALISQSCDAAQPSRPWVQVVPVEHLDPQKAGEARVGNRVGYAPLAALGPNCFACLDVIATVPKIQLFGLPRQRGVILDDDVRRYSGSVARKFGRFAFPDAVVTAIDPMTKDLSSKSRRQNSAMGKVLKKIEAIRVEAQLPDGWVAPPYDLILILIFGVGTLPDVFPNLERVDADGQLSLEDGGRPDVDSMRSLLLGDGPPSGKNSQMIATKLADVLDGKVEMSDEHLYWLWNFLAEAWASECQARADAEGVRDVVASISHEITTIDEFPMSRMNNSEDLDVDHLSAPLPRTPQQ